MAVSGVPNTTAANLPSTPSTSSASTSSGASMNLSKDDFLKLFVTSLQYQDPLSPMDNGQMMQQMSQLGMMEQVTNMTSAVDKLTENMLGNQIQQGSSLLGKIVTGKDDAGNTVTGEASKLVVNDGIVDLLVNNTQIQIGSIQEVDLS
jgi:flagellar basal-body rod modification protein FlgD